MICHDRDGRMVVGYGKEVVVERLFPHDDR